MEQSQPLSKNVNILIHELLVPLKTIVGAHSLLDGKVPETIEVPLDRFGQISNKLHTEIMALFSDPSAKINLRLAEMATEQIRLLSMEWEKDAEKLSQLISQINATNTRLEDELLNKVLNKILPNGLRDFRKYLTDLRSIQSEQLMLK